MPASDLSTYNRVIATIRRHDPDFRVVSKQKSRLHRFVGWCLRFPWIFGWALNGAYMEDFWTTFGHTTAYPRYGSPVGHVRDWPTVAHEGLHGVQAGRNTPFGMAAAYLLGTPFYGVMLALLTVALIPLWLLVVPWPWLFLPLGLGLVLSSPWPWGYWRGRWELQAYGVTMAVRYWRYGVLSDLVIDRIADDVSGAAYFYARPSRLKAVKMLHDCRIQIISGEIFQGRYGRYYQDLYSTVAELGLSKVQYIDF